MSSWAGSLGMAARTKNWFCAAAQVTLVIVPSYSELGVPGKQPSVLFANHAGFTVSVFSPFDQIAPTARPLSSGPTGVAVPTTHSWAGRAIAWEDRFSRRTFAETR